MTDPKLECIAVGSTQITITDIRTLFQNVRRRYPSGRSAGWTVRRSTAASSTVSVRSERLRLRSADDWSSDRTHGIILERPVPHSTARHAMDRCVPENCPDFAEVAPPSRIYFDKCVFVGAISYSRVENWTSVETHLPLEIAAHSRRTHRRQNSVSPLRPPTLFGRFRRVRRERYGRESATGCGSATVAARTDGGPPPRRVIHINIQYIVRERDISHIRW